MLQPIGFPSGPSAQNWSWFRCGVQPKPFNDYLNGRYHDPVYFAPKDETILGDIAECIDVPGEFTAFPDNCNPAWMTHALSPAGLFNPMVFADDGRGSWWNAPWEMPSGYQVPSFGQVRYPTLKTHMLEHAWLQNTKVGRNGAFTG
jgi:hypothetical protein